MSSASCLIRADIFCSFSQARDELGVEFLVGFESEFILLAGESPFEPVSTHEFSSSQALRAGAVATIVMDEIARQVQASDIELQMYHGEASPGQVCFLSSQISA
jgi:glutamine synthetase